MVNSILNDKGATLFNESILSLNILSALKKTSMITKRKRESLYRIIFYFRLYAC